jgi:TolB-like protein
MPDQLPPFGAVFLSYASEDAEAAACICEALRAAGIEVWFDRSELRGGDAWDSQIKKQIHDCVLFVPLISAHTNARIEGYFRGEWTLATRRLANRAHDAAFLIPVVVDETRESDARVPEEFLQAQWTWLPGGETSPAFALRVRHLLGGDRSTVHTAESVANARMESSFRVGYERKSGAPPLRFLTPALLAVVVLAGGAFWYFQDVRNTTTANPAAPPASTEVVAAPQEKSIAVLSFADMSAEKNQEYMSDGIAEELINLLAQIPDLKVVARTSSFAFKGQNMNIADIANKLNVAHVLEGSVRTSGDKLRITAQLVRAADSTRLWSQTYDRQITNVFEIQDQIAASVVAELKARLLDAAPKVQKTDPRTYGLFLQARELGRQFTKAGFERSNELYKQALRVDPRYGPAWEGLARNYRDQSFSGLIPTEEGMRLARQATEKALAINPSDARAHRQMSWIASSYDLDMSAAAEHLENALALEPANPDVLVEAAYFARRLGRLDQAIAISKHQISLDPINPYSFQVLAYTYRSAGLLDDAIAALQTALQLSPGFLAGHEGIGEVLLQKGDAKTALEEIQQESLDGLRLVGLAMAHHALGHEAESDAAVEKLIEDHAAEYSFNIAYVFAFRGEADRAFEWLNNAAEYRDLYLSAVAVYPIFTNIHADPRWLPFLRKHGMAPEQLAAIKFDVKLPQ